MGEERLDLRAEDERAADLRVVQRLDAVAVARQRKSCARLVPEREGEHAVEAQDRLCPQSAKAYEHHLGVGARAKLAAQGLELRAQLPEIVDLAVVASA